MDRIPTPNNTKMPKKKNSEDIKRIMKKKIEIVKIKQIEKNIN